MNLIWRCLWMWITAHFAVRTGRLIDIMGEGALTFRCLPTDLDYNRHMTNSRYASFGDLSRVSFMIRNGAWGRLAAEKFFPVLGSATFRFRRGLTIFEKFTVTTSILTWDDKWIYLLHKYITATDVAAVAVVKVAFVTKGGRAPTERVLTLMQYTGPKPESPIPKEVLDLDAVLKA